MKGLIAPGDLALIVGQPGAGKSLLGPLLAHAIASGRQVFGRRVRQGRVLYVAAEAGADMQVRFVALRERHGAAEGLHLLSESLDLNDPNSGDMEALQGVISRLRPDVIVLDTLAAGFPGLLENEAADMGRAVRALRDLGRVSGAAVIAVHHTAKEGTTPRGHGNLNGDADVVLRIEGTEDEPRKVTASKNRNGPSGYLFDFGLEMVDLGTDSDGDVIRRPVAVEVEHGEAGQQPKGRPLSEGQQGWWRDLCDMFAEPGAARERVPIQGVTARVTLTREQVRDGFRQRGRLGDAGGDAAGDGKLTGAQRNALYKMLNTLKDKGRIGMTDELVWLAL